MKFKAIPTRYKGIQFRSRLEARWAVMFDMLKWKWEYEPYDLEGWIPDFCLTGKKEDTLVEVKPFSKLKDFKTVIKEVEAVNDEMSVLLLGKSPFEPKAWNDACIAIGWCNDEGQSNYDEAVVNAYKRKYGFFHSSGSYEDRITGLYDGTHFLSPASSDDIMRMWREAGNVVQWKRI